MAVNPDDGLPRPPAEPVRPVRSLWQREPVRVMNSVFTLIAAINAVLLGAGVYDGAVAGVITGVIAAVAAFANEIYTRAEVVPLRPLEDLAEAAQG
jgi:energy-converting hydrogenase Eha subunit A